MDTEIWIVRDIYGRFLMNTLSGIHKRVIRLPYSQNDGQIKGFTFTADEMKLFLERINADYFIPRDDLIINQVYFNKNTTMVIVPNTGE